MSEKKQSLFKQRMKDKSVKPVQGGFPEVMKIEIQEPPKPQVVQQTKQPSSITKPLLQTMKQSHLIQQTQFDEISKQNSEFISKLTDKEIEQMQKQIQQELPSGFLDKLRKAVEGPKEEMVDEHEDVWGMAKGMEQEEETKMEVESIVPTQIREARKGLEDRFSKLCIHPVTKQIMYDQHQSPQEMINLNLIKLMMQSGNNQSIMTGLKVLGEVIQALSKQSYAYGVAIMANYYWDYWTLLDYIGQNFIKPALSEFQHNTFKTWRVQCVETSLKYLAAGGQVLPGQTEFIIAQVEKQKNVADFSQLVNQAKKPKVFVSLWEKLYHEGNAVTYQQLMLILNNPTILVEKLLIQHVYYCGVKPARKTELQLMKTYYDDLVAKASTYKNSCETELVNTLNILYRIVQICVLKIKMKAYDIATRNFLMKLGDSLKNIIMFLVRNNPTHSIDIYRSLFIIKWCRKEDFIHLLQKISPKQGQAIEPILVLINTKLYLKQDWSSHQITLFTNTLNIILSWTNDKQSYLNMQLLLLQLVKIFRHQGQSYQNLPQVLFDNVFDRVISSCSPAALQKLFNTNRVKELVKSYIYNSFGNVVFSKIMMFFGSNLFEEGNQLYIATECYQRYPFIFYEAGKQKLYTVQQDGLYDFNKRSEAVKSELQAARKMLVEHKGQNNTFLRLLGQ